MDAVSCLPRSNRANDRGNGIGYPGGFGHAGDGAQGNRGAAKQAVENTSDRSQLELAMMSKVKILKYT